MSSKLHEDALQQRIGYEFKDAALLRRALTHGSVGDGKRVPDNERMEFLGDRVLGLIVAQLLFSDPARADEGKMARLLNLLVKKQACAKAARAAGLGEALYMSKSEERNGGRDKDSILGDACEAVLAALYLDGGLPAAKSFFDTFWAEQLSSLPKSAKDPKSALQEWAAARGKPLPKYKLVDREGPDHAPQFTVTVSVDKDKAVGTSTSKQDAERTAARALLKAVGMK